MSRRAGSLLSLSLVAVAWWWLSPSREVERLPGPVAGYLTPVERVQLGLVDEPVFHVRDLDERALQTGCPVIDCISAIDRPSFEPVPAADRWLREDDTVLSLVPAGVRRAYPLRILAWHEIVNDTLPDGTPAVVTYCPLCHSGLAFVRPDHAGEALTFGVSGRLYRSDLVMFDRATGTFWSQIEARALVGPLAGRVLTRLSLEVVPWRAWRRDHPAGEVLARPTFATPLAGRAGSAPPPAGLTRTRGRFVYDYGEDPYRSYRADANDTFGTPFTDTRLGPKAEVVGLVLAGRAWAFPLAELEGRGVFQDLLGGVPLALVWDEGTVRAWRAEVGGQRLRLRWAGDDLVDAVTGTRWSPDGRARSGPLRGERLVRIETLRTYWFAWLAFHPGSALVNLAQGGTW